MKLKPDPELGTGAQVAVACLVLLGLLGASLTVAYGGFQTSPKGGGQPVFVPAPLAYGMAIPQYGMSLIGLIALLRARKFSKFAVALGCAVYAGAAVVFVWVLPLVLRPH